MATQLSELPRRPVNRCRECGYLLYAIAVSAFCGRCRAEGIIGNQRNAVVS